MNSINKLNFVVEKSYVFCDLLTELLNVILGASTSKGQASYIAEDIQTYEINFRQSENPQSNVM